MTILSTRLPALVLLTVCLAAPLGCTSTEPQPKPAPTPQPRDPDRLEVADADDLVPVFEAAFPGWAWSTLTARRQEAVKAGLSGDLRGAGSGRWVSLTSARGAIHDAIQAGDVFGADTLAIAVVNEEAYRGGGLSLDQAEALSGAARDELSDAFASLRFRELKDEESEVRQAAIALGVAPSTERLAEFSELFKAPFVLTFSVEIEFSAPLADDEENVGILHGRGEALFFHRGSGTVLARVRVATGQGGMEPRGQREGEALYPLAEDVARSLGRELARLVSARIFARLYAGQ
ncbi:MAG: hypothetical protein JKY65_25640 [Planctomycetes bacterium]|nr:hypothetical protein [Planctomycetota bacterium]